MSQFPRRDKFHRNGRKHLREETNRAQEFKFIPSFKDEKQENAE